MHERMTIVYCMAFIDLSVSNSHVNVSACSPDMCYSLLLSNVS